MKVAELDQMKRGIYEDYHKRIAESDPYNAFKPALELDRHGMSMDCNDYLYEGQHYECANLCNAQMSQGGFTLTRFDCADFTKADLTGACLYYAECSHAMFLGADLSGADLEEAGFYRAHFIGANLEGANLENAYLLDVNLEGAKLKGAILKNTYITKSSLNGVDLDGVDLTDAVLVDDSFLDEVDNSYDITELEKTREYLGRFPNDVKRFEELVKGNHLDDDDGILDVGEYGEIEF